MTTCYFLWKRCVGKIGGGDIALPTQFKRAYQRRTTKKTRKKMPMAIAALVEIVKQLFFQHSLNGGHEGFELLDLFIGKQLWFAVFVEPRQN